MENIKLQAQKKEIAKLDKQTLANICIRLAKYKSENKELLNYLLFYSYDNQPYIDTLKLDITKAFGFTTQNEYTISRLLKNLLTHLNKHLKFIADKNLEAEILLAFCNAFIEKIDMRGSYIPLVQVLYRQLVKICKVVEKLDEDLQFDYQIQIDIIFNALKKSNYYKHLKMV
ncbi:MAG: hypothetical protein EAZ51_07060 [Sphingobacteriales bacterium]|nr:MAG: hypothetical protein EAZ64_00925 [Sphingobacteriales bacterium]TAF79848.1 MAG: hypothetical protein EAZ51_07060 [Sphingobacteriales bacterium]